MALIDKNNNTEQKGRRVRKSNQKLRFGNSKLKLQIKALNKKLKDLEPAPLYYEKASEIAHEINNPINLVSNSISILEVNIQYIIKLTQLYKEMKDVNNPTTLEDINAFEKELNMELTTKELTKSISRIKKGISRVNEISSNLAFIGKSKNPILLKTDINQSIRNTLSMAGSAFDESIELQTQFGNIPILKSVRGKLNQVFTNLIENAIEAIREKPKLKNEYLSIKTSKNNTDVLIEIKDSGIGMTAETKERLYEKFYTTKSPDKGTGLGMSISKRIIEEHNGTIEVESEFGKGTKFTICLPIEQ
ncbi:MAG: HAMP domain-containing sensor histidine kinase [Flavobacteriales bacterium]|nr:HAMP domain-containing sensor histidine kinase [Flavobacteriales bacterium]